MGSENVTAPGRLLLCAAFGAVFGLGLIVGVLGGLAAAVRVAAT